MNVDEARREAERAGYNLFVLPATGVVDRASFFDAVRAKLPLDPPLESSRSWDALADSLWEGLCAHESRRIAILWPGAVGMARTSAADFDRAMQVLADLVESLADPVATQGNPKTVAILVESRPSST